MRDHGARCDGVADDTGALRSALAAAATVPGGTVVEVPRGRCLLTETVTQVVDAGRGILLRGPGGFVSPNGAGLHVVLAGADSGFDVERISFIRSGSGQAGTALTVEAKVTQALSVSRFRDLTFVGNTAVGGTAQWLVGMRLVGLSSPVIDAMRSLMADGTGNGSGTGLSLVGIDPQHYLTDAKINASIFQGGSVGIAASGAIQGVFVVNSEAIGNDYGIHASDPGGSMLAEAVMVSNSHFNNSRAGIHLDHVTQGQVANSLFLHFRPESGLPWSAIDAGHAGYLTVQGNGLVGAGTKAPGGEAFLRATGGGQLYAITGNNVVNLNGYCIDARTESNVLASGNSCQAVTAPGIVLGPGSRAVANIVNGAADPPTASR